jgi:methylmalonyl-CoA mutase
MAIQLIINREYGIYKNENVLQGSFIIEELTALVEEAILQEFERISERGGVLGAMERGYQRSRIQEESLLYEYQKDTGQLPIVGVNTFTNPHEDADAATGALTIARGTEDERRGQLARVADYHTRYATEAADALAQLKQVCLEYGNTFAALMDATKVCTLGQITRALFEVGGKYRRNT